MNPEYNFIPTDEEQDNYIKTSLKKLLHNKSPISKEWLIEQDK